LQTEFEPEALMATCMSVAIVPVFEPTSWKPYLAVSRVSRHIGE